MANSLFLGYKKLKSMLDNTYAEVIAEQTLILQTTQVVAVGASSAQSSIVGENTNRVVLSPTVDCWISIGTDPTAVVNTSGSFFLSANSQSYPIEVKDGLTKIAVIQISSSGYLSIIESA